MNCAAFRPTPPQLLGDHARPRAIKASANEINAL
jgi:hypothetical protein